VIEQTATVRREEGEFVWVEAQVAGGCRSCASGGHGCGASTLARALGGRVRRIRVRNDKGSHFGDTVLLGMDERAIVRGSFLLYAIPVLAMLAGGMVAALCGGLLGLPGGDAVEAMGAATGLTGGILYARRSLAAGLGGYRYEAVMLRVLGRGDCALPTLPESGPRRAVGGSN